MIKRFLSVCVLVLLFTGMLAFAPSKIASAATVQQRAAAHQLKPVAANLCKSQSSAVVVYYPGVPGGVLNYGYFKCSGTYNMGGLAFNLMSAGSWSGYIYVNDGYGPFWQGYCDGDIFSGGELITLYLSPVRETWCS